MDPTTGLVRIGAGTRLHELSRLLDEHGLAMPNLGDINVQSAAGAISTATHGTGRNLGNLATTVESIELVKADGSIVELDSGDDLRAARVSVGALGVITAYTLRTVPSFRLHLQREKIPLTQVLAELDERVDSNDHFEFFAFPHARDALTKTTNRTEEPANPSGRIVEYFNEVIVENHVLGALSTMGRRWPSQIPRLNRAVTALASSGSLIDASHRVFSSPRLVRITETEWAVPREACADLVREIQAETDRQGFAVNIPFEVRFVAADDASLLSPSFGRETAYVAVHMYEGMPWKPYFETVQRIAGEYGGRPHWGKRHSLSAADLAGRYPEWDTFQEVRRAYDPDGVFANDHIRRIFGA
ncbi:putative oxidoreductase [Gordonia spumicola]|uniref:Putative oxidoreductase n=1 Tax=Gordonia spumicola TaxID=589161 RepID=A0A7I9VBF1_9ACTN|nr:putative oxidoreductase [Gordonia spumicola]